MALVKRALVKAVRDGKVEAEDRFSGDAIVIDAAALIACGQRLPDVTVVDRGHRRGDRLPG